MKTIFITSFHAHISRNILYSDLFAKLFENGIGKVVILTPDYKKEYFEKNFSGKNIIIEGIKPYQSSKSALGLFFKNLAIYLLDSDTTRIKRQLKLHQGKLLHYAAYTTAAFIGKSKLFKRLFLAADEFVSPRGFFAALIEQYKPEIIFSTDAQNENDVALVRDAGAFGIPVLSMVRSWDNLSQRVLRIRPKKLLVGAEAMKEEAISFHGFPKERITIAGYPYYDRYLETAPTRSREVFFKGFGLDLTKKLILYAPIGDPTVSKNDIDKHIISLLGKIDANILVRLPTNLSVSLDGFQIPKNVVLDKPGFAFGDRKAAAGFLDNEITKEDDNRLVDSLYWSDLVVAGPTSICLDAILFDKPVIAVNFYQTPRHFFDQIYQYRYYHFKRLLETGAVYEAKSGQDFFAAIHRYLNNPVLDSEKRKHAKSLWLSHVDGKSSGRITNAIMSVLV